MTRRSWLDWAVPSGMLVALLALVIGAPLWWDRHQCMALGRETGIPVKYPSPLAGCYVRINGQWIPVDKWRAVQP